MDRVVHKYQLIPDKTPLQVPQGAKVVHVGRQEGFLYAWIEHEATEFDPDVIQLEIFGTGWEIKDPELQHVQTFVDGGFVWHVYAKKM